VGMVQSAKLALPIAICAISETVCYFAKINIKKSSANWRNVILAVISEVISNTRLDYFLPASVEIPNRSDIKPTQIIIQHDVPCMENHRSLIPSVIQCCVGGQ